MTQDFEYMSYDEGDRLTMLENRAAELERRLLAVSGDAPGEEAMLPNTNAPNVGALPPDDVTTAFRLTDFAPTVPPEASRGVAGVAGDAGDDEESEQDGTARPDGRTEALINHGRRRAKRSRGRWLLAHWRALAIAIAAFAGALLVVVAILPGGGASWPASVARVQAEITQACENPNVPAEPSQADFACAKDTQRILWVFALLTSGDNPNFVDQSTGRKGLEPIQPSQGGDIAWSLNLHHPYDPANPLDSLEVAARAINNIISGATLTSSSGSPLVEPGLESKSANCARYTGSAQIVAPQGFPARCALSVTTGSGEAALVSDVFEQWMAGTPAQMASEAGVLFENANNPGAPQVQAILQSLPNSGQ
jgi:hypothetical protein